MMTIIRDDELMHYGVLGMKWGVRRFQNYDGTPILKKGTIVKRVSTSKADPTFDNKKYVSINQEDHEKWETYLGEGYVKMNMATYTQTYITNKDMKVMTSAKQGEMYKNMLLDTKFKNKAIEDTEYANDFLNGVPESKSNAENISRNIAAQTETGKAFIKRALDEGYDIIFDTHGTNTSENPIIVLNPDTNLTRYSDPVYTKPVQDFLNRYYGVRVA